MFTNPPRDMPAFDEPEAEQMKWIEKTAGRLICFLTTLANEGGEANEGGDWQVKDQRFHEMIANHLHLWNGVKEHLPDVATRCTEICHPNIFIGVYGWAVTGPEMLGGGGGWAKCTDAPNREKFLQELQQIAEAAKKAISGEESAVDKAAAWIDEHDGCTYENLHEAIHLSVSHLKNCVAKPLKARGYTNSGRGKGGWHSPKTKKGTKGTV